LPLSFFRFFVQDGRSKGCAFVRYHTQHAAALACATLNNSKALPGCARALVVKFAEAEPPGTENAYIIIYLPYIIRSIQLEL